MSFVIDASSTLAFSFPDERDARALSIGDRLMRDGAVAPLIWAWEVENAVLVAERRKRVSANAVTAFITELASLPVQLDTSPTFGNELSIARRYSLSAYDALYLDLAFRLSLPLASLDRSLRAAAKKLGVPVL